MDDKLLVEEIIGRVLEKMKNFNAAVESTNEKPKLLILNEDHETRCHNILENAHLLEYYNTECALMKNYACNLEDYEAVILFHISNDVLSKLSAGICDSPFLNLASKAILTGKKVYVPTEEVELYQYQDTAPKAYYGMMLEKVNFLKACGVIFCNEEQLESVILEGTVAEETVSEPEVKNVVPAMVQKSVTIDKRIITEKDIEKAYADGATIICLSNKAILSDLAKDYAKYRNIQFEKSQSLSGKQRNRV